MNHELLQVQIEVLMSLIETRQKHEMAPRVLALLGGGLRWDLAVLWEAEGEALVMRACWRSPELPASALETATRELRLARGRGLPGRAWALKETVWSTDVASEPDFLRGAGARADGIRCAVLVPLLSRDRVTGVLELFRRDAAPPERPLVEGLSLLGRAVGTYLERMTSRNEIEAALRALDAELHDRDSKLAREIHDILGQELTGLKLDVAWVGRRLAANSMDPPVLIERLEAMSRSIDGVLQTVRRIATDLRAGMLEDLGLAAAIEAQVREVSVRSGLAIELDLDPPPAIDVAVGTAVFRAVQELLTNILRHAGARRATISLRQEGAFLELRVRDDGAGIDPSALHAPTLGLLGIRERALAYGGNFQIAPLDGGTEAVLRLPQITPGGTTIGTAGGAAGGAAGGER